MRRFAVLAMAGLGLTLAACGGGSTKAAAPPATAAPTAAPTTATPPDAAIAHAYTTFFNAATPPATALTFLENGSTYTPQLAQLAKLMPKGLTAKVDSVSVTDASTATVTYELVGADGTSLLGKPSSGKAVFSSGKWVVSASTFCGLATLAGATCNG